MVGQSSHFKRVTYFTGILRSISTLKVPVWLFLLNINLRFGEKLSLNLFLIEKNLKNICDFYKKMTENKSLIIIKLEEETKETVSRKACLKKM